MRPCDVWLCAALGVAACARTEAEPRPLTVYDAQVSAVVELRDAVVAAITTEVLPLRDTLLARGAEYTLGSRIASALYIESRRAGLDPWLMLRVLLVENPWLDSAAVSDAGAVGLMQVMPRWHVPMAECGILSHADLARPEPNICAGVRVYAAYWRDELREAERRALLRYNGCRRTPGCEVYAERVSGALGGPE